MKCERCDWTAFVDNLKTFVDVQNCINAWARKLQNSNDFLLQVRNLKERYYLPLHFQNVLNIEATNTETNPKWNQHIFNNQEREREKREKPRKKKPPLSYKLGSKR